MFPIRYVGCPDGDQLTKTQVVDAVRIPESDLEYYRSISESFDRCLAHVNREERCSAHSQRATIVLDNNLHTALGSSRSLTGRILIIKIGNSALDGDTLRPRHKIGDLRLFIVLGWDPRLINDRVQDSINFGFCKAIPGLLGLRLS